MEYGLMRDVLESSRFIPISAAEFRAVADAKSALITLLGLEEKFTLVLENYKELEHELLQITLQYALHRPESWSAYTATIHQVNRRIVNLLSAARLYLDQLRHDVLSLPDVPRQVQESVLQRPSVEYDQRQGYRAMEALRNYVQHRGLPLHRISTGGSWRDTTEGEKRVHYTVLYLDIEALGRDEKFKRAVYRELTGTTRDGKVPLKPLVRDYMTGLFSVQSHARTTLDLFADKWAWHIEAMMDRFRQEEGESLLGLMAVARSDGGEEQERVAVFADFIHRREWLERRNRGAGDLATLIISSE